MRAIHGLDFEIPTLFRLRWHPSGMLEFIVSSVPVVSLTLNHRLMSEIPPGFFLGHF
jgi:hypothetical protein